MASAYDDHRAALEQQCSALMHAEEERNSTLQLLVTRQRQASEEMTSAVEDCRQMTAEVMQCAMVWALSGIDCSARPAGSIFKLIRHVAVQADQALETAAEFWIEVAQIRHIINVQQAAQELSAELRSTELKASDDLQVSLLCSDFTKRLDRFNSAGNEFCAGTVTAARP